MHPNIAIPFYQLFQNFNQNNKGGVQENPDDPSPVTEPTVTNDDLIREFYKLFGIEVTDDLYKN